jgi:hypothetical protein
VPWRGTERRAGVGPTGPSPRALSEREREATVRRGNAGQGKPFRGGTCCRARKNGGRWAYRCACGGRRRRGRGLRGGGIVRATGTLPLTSRDGALSASQRRLDTQPTSHGCARRAACSTRSEGRTVAVSTMGAVAHSSASSGAVAVACGYWRAICASTSLSTGGRGAVGARARRPRPAPGSGLFRGRSWSTVKPSSPQRRPFSSSASPRPYLGLRQSGGRHPTVFNHWRDCFNTTPTLAPSCHYHVFCWVSLRPLRGTR